MEHAACVEHLIEVGHLLQNHTNTLVECARSQIRCYFSTESLILYMYMLGVRRKVRIRTILGFSCANRGS